MIRKSLFEIKTFTTEHGQHSTTVASEGLDFALDEFERSDLCNGDVVSVVRIGEAWMVKE